MFKQNAKRVTNTKTIITYLNSKGLTNYKIACILDTHKIYVSRRSRYATPRTYYYKLLCKLYDITSNVISSLDNKSFTYEEIEKRIQQKYKEFIASPLYDLLKESTARRSSYNGNQLSSPPK